MPSREEIARRLREAGKNIALAINIRPYPTYSKLCEERAKQVENMRCEACSRLFIVTGGDGEGIPCQWSGSGGCWRFKQKETQK